ncbi:hypothetical protein AGMMS49525_00900 [Bacteroidia bacterium]|nr:hypothetical protein AGMMS49525_00900 [Bacteroidia bacterium]
MQANLLVIQYLLLNLQKIMKALDLNAYGVSEMSHAQLLEAEGGGLLGDIGYFVGYYWGNFVVRLLEGVLLSIIVI